MVIRSCATVFGLLLACASAAIQASDVTGPIEVLRGHNPPSGAPGRIAVRVTGAATSCGVTDWYVFENGDTGIGKVWTSLLLTAYSLGKDVTILGDGVCHTYPDAGTATLEGVNRVELR